jgi:Ca-activated chloride channel homolog
MKKLAGIAAALMGLAASSAQAADDVMIVFDGSNSMWGQIDGVAKIEIARDAMGSLMGDWAEGTNVGLMAYGHRREGDCSDIETVIAPGPIDREHFMSRVRAITPRGKTPLTSAVEEAARILSFRDNPATVVLITDGIETCQRDPCALAEELERMGVGFTAHVVGFDLQGAEHEAVACIAERTGGRFLAAGDAAELAQALSEVGAAVAAAPEPEPEPEPAPAVDLTVPTSAVVGESFAVSWSTSEQQPRDFLTIVPMGAKEGDRGGVARVRDDTDARLRAPAEPGLYEVRYVMDEGRRTLASAEIEIVGAQVSLTAPGSATTGSTFSVSWSGTVHPRDFLTIVPMGADEGDRGNYVRTGDKSDATLQAPAEPGLYEVRYVLEEGRRTLAAAEIEIVGAQVSLTAPESATTGSTFSVSWSGTVHPRDFLTILPMGADEGDRGNYVRTGDKSDATLQAPAEPGLYEVRYVLEEGRRTLAAAEIEIVGAQVSLTAPENATTGSTFSVSWSGTVHPRDFLTIVPMGADEGDRGNYVRTGDKSDATLQAPAEPGLYEVRYVLEEGRRTLATAAIEIVEADIELLGPDTVRAESQMRVSWSGTAPSRRDFVTIVPMGADEGVRGQYARVGDASETDLAVPQETGLYEVRYVLEEGRRTLARHMVEVVAATAPLGEGDALSVPETGAPGEAIEVSWSTDANGNDRRVALAKAGQADFTWMSVQSAGDGPLSFTLPDAPGYYEFRLLDITERKVLGRATIEVR